LVTRLKQSVWKLLAVALSVGALFCVLPGLAAAQDIATAPAEGIQSADQYTNNLPTTSIVPQATPEPVAVPVAPFGPNDPQWSMSQERPEDAPAQTTNQAENITEANRPLMEDGTNPVELGQELLPPAVVESATSEPIKIEADVEEPVTSDSATKESAASKPVDAALKYKPALGLDMTERHLLGLGIFVLTVVFAVFIAREQLMRYPARVSVINPSRAKPKGTDRTRASDLKGRLPRREGASDLNHPLRLRCFLKRPSRAREHRRPKGL
jgi:hypothetical protein